MSSLGKAGFSSQCIIQGVDANRNWGFHWNEGGSSSDKCSDTYHGPEAFSEPENVNVRDMLNTRRGDWVFYNSIHSYSQLILLPWGYTDDVPNDYDEMYNLFMKGSDALTAVHGKTYEVCDSSEFYSFEIFIS